LSSFEIVNYLVLPLGIASAQDYEAVEKRLGEAVSKGELTLEHASAMMSALRAASDRDVSQRGDARAEYEGFERRIKSAVREGKTTRVEAGEKLKGFRRRLGMADDGKQLDTN